jgi:hypothetical protein
MVFKVPLTLDEMTNLSEALKDIVMHLERRNKIDEYARPYNYQLDIANRNRKIEKYNGLINRINSVYLSCIAIDIED